MKAMFAPAVTTTVLRPSTSMPFSERSLAPNASTSCGTPWTGLYLWFSGSARNALMLSTASWGGP